MLQPRFRETFSTLYLTEMNSVYILLNLHESNLICPIYLFQVVSFIFEYTALLSVV